MNCKPGDIAVSIGKQRRLVEVLYAAPYHDFILPNGQHQIADYSAPSWVVKLLDGTMLCGFRRRDETQFRVVSMGVAADRVLRPISDPDAEVLDECCESTSGATHGDQ